MIFLTQYIQQISAPFVHNFDSVPSAQNAEEDRNTESLNQSEIETKLNDIEQGLKAELHITQRALDIYTSGLENIKSTLSSQEADEDEAEIQAIYDRITRYEERISEIQGKLSLDNDDQLVSISERGDEQKDVFLYSDEALQAKKEDFTHVYMSFLKVLESYERSPQLDAIRDNFLKIPKPESFDGNISDQALIEIGGYIAEIKELQTTFHIIQSDAKILENGETLGEARETILQKNYHAIVDNFNETQQKQYLLEVENPNAGYKKFSDLTSDDISSIHENGGDLASIFIVENNGNEFSGFTENTTYVWSTGGNNDIPPYNHGLIFSGVETLNVSGIEYSRGKDGVFYNNNLPMTLQDGQEIIVQKKGDISEKQQRSLTNMQESDRRSRLISDVSQVAEESGFSIGEFIKKLLAGDLKGLVGQLTYLLEFNFKQDPEMPDTITAEDPYKPGRTFRIEEMESITDVPSQWHKQFFRSADVAGKTPNEFMDYIKAECARTGFSTTRFIMLIGKESAWRYDIKNPTSSAYGLGQMIGDTWTRFGSGNRSNPLDQIEASLKYLAYIKDRNNCSDEDACAFYNTGHAFKVNDQLAPADYVAKNGAIANLIPENLQKNGITRREYFIAAVAYYNSIDYHQAKSLSKVA